MAEFETRASQTGEPVAKPVAADAEGGPPWWFRLCGRMLRPWIRISREPEDPARLIAADRKVCYVVERHGLSDALILERACHEAGLPQPTASLSAGGLRRRFSMFSLSRREGWLLGRVRKRASDTVLTELIEALGEAPGDDVQIVPVSIFVGRAPGKTSGWFRVLFSENWVVVGRFRRLLAVLLNGRHTVVQFSEPIALRRAMDEWPVLEPPMLARKVSRVLRVHFRRIRAVVIGPDLSHRRTVVDAVLDAPPVREAIADSARRNDLSPAKAYKRARKMVMEIAADYSHPLVRSSAFMLSGFWNKLYDGIAMRHFDRARAAAPGHEIIYVPSHRSHADYLLLSYQLHVSGVVIPHIAAGINLNLPVLGSYLRRGGAFFLRRSFKGSALYSIIFKEYLAQLIDRGVPIEYFIEGGRSRTGRLLQPRGGMLSMTLRAFLRAPRRSVLFQPVYIGYEKLMEGNSYVGELSGGAKQKESWTALFRATRKVMKQHYGHVSLNFGEPILLTDVLDDTGVDWRNMPVDDDAKPEWFTEAVDDLARRIQVNINAAADVNPVNLLALVVLATPKHAIAESDLLRQLELTRDLLRDPVYSSHVTITDAEPAAIVAHGERMGWIERLSHEGGDVLRSEGSQAVLLSYFRNNVLHLVAAIAWVASCFVTNDRMSRSSVLRLGRIIYPFIRDELFLTWDEAGFEQQLRATIDAFVDQRLLGARSGGRRLQRIDGDEDAAFRLRLLAHPLQQAFERYYIVIATLVENGPGMLTSSQLEKVCIRTAQRLSLLHELNAPEFFDPALFRGFIRRLRRSRMVHTRDDGTLDFEPALADLVEDARIVLSGEVRHSIRKITASNARTPTETVENAG